MRISSSPTVSPALQFTFFTWSKSFTSSFKEGPTNFISSSFWHEKSNLWPWLLPRDNGGSLAFYTTGFQLFSPRGEFSPWETKFYYSWDQCKWNPEPFPPYGGPWNPEPCPSYGGSGARWGIQWRPLGFWLATIVSWTGGQSTKSFLLA